MNYMVVFRENHISDILHQKKIKKDDSLMKMKNEKQKQQAGVYPITFIKMNFKNTEKMIR